MDTIMVDDNGQPLRDQGGVYGNGAVNPVGIQWFTFSHRPGDGFPAVPVITFRSEDADVYSVADLVADWYDSQPGRRNGVES